MADSNPAPKHSPYYFNIFIVIAIYFALFITVTYDLREDYKSIKLSEEVVDNVGYFVIFLDEKFLV
jgi:hypothetical protein